jgi:filamentous hemagglutinin family protein
VLAGLGILGLTLPAPAPAQTAGGVLAAGTLPVLRSVVSGQATVNAAVQGASSRVLTIDQQSSRAIIDWKSFNIAGDAEVRFNQPSSTASALNRIYSADPTVIQGRLTANGQVLLINQNGILFDRGAQVNVQSLVASTLNMSNDRYNSGALSIGGLTSPAFEGGYDDAGHTLPTRPDGTLPGAIGIGTSGAAAAAAPALTAAAGGSILLLAPRIDNQAGVISARDGQVILAAGGKAYLALADGTDSTLRGFQVEVEAAGGSDLNLTDLIRNAGSIGADRGNVTLAALAINQDGRVSATTAIQANGSVFLQARTLGNLQSGSVSLGAGSVTEVQPDRTDTATMPEGANYADPTTDRRGEIRFVGHTLASAGTLQAPGGKITLTAQGATPDASADATSAAADASTARIYFGAGSLTSVAGDWADVPYADNLLTFKVTSNELKDAPDQKSGILKGATVTVDLRKGSPLLDLSGYIAAQARTVAEKAAQGGDLLVTSSGAIIQRAGATLDASGGGYRYAGGTAATSKLLGSDGKIYDISSAPQARAYTTLLDSYTRTDTRWNQSRTWTGLLYGLGQAEAAAVAGKSGGTISLVSAAGLVLDGTLAGGVTVGPGQLASAPRGAALTIGAYNANDGQFIDAQRIGNVDLVQQASDTLGSGFGATSALSTAQLGRVTLAAGQLYGGSASGGGYLQTGFDSVEINSNGRFTVPEGVSVAASPGATLIVRAPQIEIAGALSLPAGTLTLQPVATGKPISEDLRGNTGITVRGSAALSTAGVWVNKSGADGSYVGGALPTARVTVAADGSSTTTSMLDGGKLTLSAGDGTAATLLEQGATLDVGGGALLASSRQFTLGNGGTLSIANGQSAALDSDWMQATLSGYAPGNGGKLVLSTPRVEIDGAGADGPLAANTTRLSGALFADDGFSAITINTTQGIAVDADATVRLEQKNLVIDPLRAVTLASGASLQQAADAVRLPDNLRAPTNLTLNANAAALFPGQAQLTVAQGATLVADPKAAISLAAADRLQLDGRISAPGGSVTLKLAAPITGAPDLTLGASAAISVAGTFVPKPTADGSVQGTVVDAGTITLTATGTGVDLAAGSVLDLSGLTQTVQATLADDSGRVVQQAVDGNAGTLLVQSQGAVRLASTLRAARGSAQGAGGAFALELNARDTELTPPEQRRIVVTQAGTAAAGDGSTVDAPISIDALQQAGFEKLRLQSENRIELQGDVAASFRRGIRLDAPLIDVVGDGAVSLASAATVALGQSRDPRGDEGTLVPQGAAPVLATRAGAGTLAVQAGTIDLYGSLTIDGVAETRLASAGDIRLTGRTVIAPDTGADRVFGSQIGALTTAGNLTLVAAQVLPSTRSDYTLAVVAQPDGSAAAGGRLILAGNGQSAGDAYSADGRVTLVADTIVQGGRLVAPLGSIELRAGSQLVLASGSTTSVSAQGLAIPYGSTQAGLSWSYQDSLAGGTANLLVTGSADAKRIGLNGLKIDVQAGATVDLSGGGDVQASEFVPGSGGSKDTLLQANTYAIIPAAHLSSMPVDTDIAQAAAAARQDPGFGLQTAKVDSGVYDRLVIGSGAVVPAGEYVLLPARYALLPGAYLVQLQTASAYANLQPGQTATLINGQTVVAGYRTLGGTTIRQSATVGVVVRPGSAADNESDYTLTTSSYFTDLATRERSPVPRVPLDAGQLAIANTEAIALGGSFVTKPGSASKAAGTTTGQAALVDISADRIAVVDSAGTAGLDASWLQVDGAALSALGGSLLLGGERSITADGLTITTAASQVQVANTAAGALTAAELLLTASDRIDVRSGSVLVGSGAGSSAAATTIHADAGGALLRLSSGAQASVDRGAGIDATHGEIRIDAGATLRSDGALLLDATRATQSAATLKLAAGAAVSLASSQVSLGETAGVADAAGGLVLSNADLAAFAGLDVLALKGYQGIDFYGQTTLGAASLRQLTLDSAAIRGHAAATAASTITAQTVELVNRGGTAAGGAAAGPGTLAVDAQRIVFGAGDKTISGFAAVTMNAASEAVGSGVGSLAVAASWTLATPKVGVAAGAVQQWQAVDLAVPAAPVYSNLVLAGAAGTAGTTTDSAAGGRLTLAARSVEIGTTVQARSGTLTVAAKGSDGSDGVTLTRGARLDAAGTAKDYNGHVVAVDAGQVTLSAAAGAVTLQAGSAIGLAASAQGGDAGTLKVEAASLGLGGTLDAAAGSGAGGRATLDLGTLADFSALYALLAAGGVTGSIDLRLRQGDLAVAAGDVVQAHELQLAADSGRIDVRGVLDARGTAGGGTVALWAAQGLDLGAGSRIDAGGTSTDGGSGAAQSDGGKVVLATRAGTLGFDAAATIDVSPGALGRTGSVTFSVSRIAADQIGATRLEGTVLGHSHGQGTLAPVVLEAQRTYTSSGNVSSSDIAGYASDHAAFMAGASAAALLGRLRGDGGVAADASLHGATEVVASGSLNLTRAWDLTTASWLAQGLPGTLTLRAGGDLTLSTALGMPIDNIVAGQTWNLRLVGGADLTAADPLATLGVDAAAGSGNVVLAGNAAKVRTGTGTIAIAAATDYLMTGAQAVVYTAGRIGAADTATSGNNRWGLDGGDITIRAGRDAVGAADEWITEWLRRPRTNVAATPAEWWVYRPNFQQGIGTLGGGDIRIEAGRDVTDLSAMLPTTGRTTDPAHPATSTLDVQGGGNLVLRAGNDVEGSSVLVARGQGRIDAGGDVGTASPVQVYLMGVSSGDVAAQATLDIEAGGGIGVRSVNNPTAISQVNTTGSGPSFGAGITTVQTYFSYAADSTLRAVAKDGDVTLGSQMAAGRGLSVANRTLTDTTTSGAYPATLLAVALNGDVALDLTRQLVTYPSASAEVALLASGSLVNPNLTVSDLLPDAVTDIERPAAAVNVRLLSGQDLVLPGLPRLVERVASSGPLFDLQALAGSIAGAGANAGTLFLPGESRVRAGTDIRNLGLTLQNLQAGDVSEVRADNGDVLPQGLEIRGPGTLRVQAGRNVDVGQAGVLLGASNLGGLVATGNNSNASLPSGDSARLTVLAGVKGDVDLARFKAAYDELVALNSQSDAILGFYRALNGDSARDAVRAAATVRDLAARDASYLPYVELVSRYPQILASYQAAVRSGALPLGAAGDALQAAGLYALLNRETRTQAIANARSVADLLSGTDGGTAYQAYVALDQKYPLVFAEYRQRRANGALPQGLTPIVFSELLATVTDQAVPAAQVSGGSIYTYLNSIQTYGGSDIDLWAPGGNIVAGLTTPSGTVGVVTNAGGAIRSVLGGDFSINQGKVLTAQGGDILIYSSGGGIDAGRGAKTSISTPPPTRTPVTVAGVIVGYLYTIPAAASGSGIQTLSSDPDGVGPRAAPTAGNVYLFAPAGTIDAGEAGIRSGGNLVLNAQTVLNASNIAASGSSVGVPQVETGSLATSLATSGSAGSASKAAEDSAAAASASRALATTAPIAKPTILSVEVLGFGDRNCKEDDKDCFGK